MDQNWQRSLPEAQGSVTVKRNEKELWRSRAFAAKPGDTAKYQVLAYARWDDNCGNGSNTFYYHEDVVMAGTRSFSEYVGMDNPTAAAMARQIPPAFRDLKKWNGFHPFGPWSYFANTLYHAGDRDCWGLRKDERRQIVNGRTKLLAWNLVAIDEAGNEIELHKLPKNPDAAEQPPCPYRLEYRPWCRVGEGKARELDYARSSAAWLDATDDQLMDENLATALKDRLPGLLVEFRKAIESIGFTW